MPREMVTITLDREKAEAARDLLGADSTAEVVDIALDRLLRDEQLRRDVEAYRRIPPTENEIVLAGVRAVGGLSDDTDWAALYADIEP